ncbi:MAG: protein kinase, partial [Acidobacteriota bacterium]
KRVTGRTLRDVLRERIPNDLLDHRVKAGLTEVFLKVCQTVAAAHKQGVIHRDLKPENIMVDDLGVVFVMDWGLAKKLEDEADGDPEASQSPTPDQPCSFGHLHEGAPEGPVQALRFGR